MDYMQHWLCMHLCWVEFFLIFILCFLQPNCWTVLLPPLADFIFEYRRLKPCVVALIDFDLSCCRLPRPFPYLYGFGTSPWRSTGLWTCSVHFKAPLTILLQMPHYPHQPHPAPPRMGSARLLFQSLKSSALLTRWLWISPLVPFQK